MTKRHIALIMCLAVFMNACEIQQLSRPDASPLMDTSPFPSSQTGSATSTLVQTVRPRLQSSYTATPFTSNTPSASPTKKAYIVGTPTFSPTLTTIPSLKPGQIISVVNIFGMDESSGWGMEENGHIVHTKNSGATWEDVTPPQGAYNQYGFFALDAHTAWATPYCLGHLYGNDSPFFCKGPINQTNVWITHDSGKTWSPSSPICINEGCIDPISASGDGSLLPEAMRFLDSQHGWLAISRGSSMFQNRYNGFYTLDGGRNWNFFMSSYTNDTISGSIAALEPLNEEKILLFKDQAQGAIDIQHDLEYSQSNDGGKTWKDEYGDFPIPAIQPLIKNTKTSIHYPRCGTVESKGIPPLVLDLTQECHYLNETRQSVHYFIHLHSEDGGKTWNHWQQMGNVDFINAKTGWQMVLKTEALHEIQQTQDGGLSWAPVKTVEWDGMLDFVNDQIGYALAYNHGVMAVMFTADGGKTWEIKSQGSLTRVPCLISPNPWNGCQN